MLITSKKHLYSSFYVGVWPNIWAPPPSQLDTKFTITPVFLPNWFHWSVSIWPVLKVRASWFFWLQVFPRRFRLTLVCLIDEFRDITEHGWLSPHRTLHFRTACFRSMIFSLWWVYWADSAPSRQKPVVLAATHSAWVEGMGFARLFNHSSFPLKKLILDFYVSDCFKHSSVDWAIWEDEDVMNCHLCIPASPLSMYSSLSMTISKLESWCMKFMHGQGRRG